MYPVFLCFPDDNQDNDTREAETTQKQSYLKELEGMQLCMLLNAVTEYNL